MEQDRQGAWYIQWTSNSGRIMATNFFKNYTEALLTYNTLLNTGYFKDLYLFDWLNEENHAN